jgi:N-acetylglucosaminyldiphosphoundecaprenol N-acetyl-beta-D-mannosaminyltransferase
MSQAIDGNARIQGRTRRILGIDFFNDSIEVALAQAMQGGLILAPSGPGLAVDLVKTQSYRDAAAAADLVLVDSSALVLFWKALSGETLIRISGVMFLRAFLRQEELKGAGTLFWVMPSQEDAQWNFRWLEAQGFTIDPEDCYIAPQYDADAVADEELLRRIESRMPRFVMIAVGGGIQEQLGHFLRMRLPYRPGVLCLGAAIAILSGGQARIPHWIDALMIAWLLRVAHSPTRYGGRYIKAWALFPLLWKNRERMPPLRR